MDNAFVPTEQDKARYAEMRVGLLVPSADYKMHTVTCAAIANMVAYSWHHGLRVVIMGSTERIVTDWARERLGEMLLEYECPYTGGPLTHGLWIDDDQVFNADLAVRLASHGKSLVGALTYKKQPPFTPSVFLPAKGQQYNQHPLLRAPYALFECGAIGFAAVLMHRSVLELVERPWFTIDARGGEDIVFCVRAREAGISVWCDGDYRIGHIGPPQIIHERDHKDYFEAHKEELLARADQALFTKEVA